MNSFFRRSLIATALGCALSLVGCGGGDGGTGGPSTPTKSLTLVGIVTDGPISGALVTVKIGSQVFNAVAGSDGRYRVPITIPADAGNNLVSIEARGPSTGPNSKVSLISLTRSFDSLLAAAGSDSELSATEAPAVNVTHLSTANAVLVIEVNGSTPTTDAALQQAEGQVDPEEALELAAAIKLIVDSPADYSLPTGSTNTLQFAQNQSARETFIEAAKEDNPEDFAEAQEQTLSDPNVAPAPTAASMPENLTYIASVADQNTFNFTGQAHLFKFASDETGEYTSRYGHIPMEWEVEDNAIRVVLEQPLVDEPYMVYDLYDETRQDFYYCTNNDSYNSLVVVRLSERSARITRGGSSQQACQYESDGTVFERELGIESVEFVTRVSNENLLPAPDLSTAKSFASYTLNLGQETRLIARLGADVLSFNPGGSGSSRFLAGNFTWQKSSDGKTLTVAFANGVVSTYQVVRNIDTQTAVVLYTSAKANGQTYADVNLRFLAAPVDPLTPDLVPGAYYQFGVGEENPAFDPLGFLDGFWLEFYNDGTGRQINDYYELDENGEIARDENGQPIVGDTRGNQTPRFLWTSTANSITNIRTYNNAPEVQGTRYSSCPEGAIDCVVWDRREIFPINFVERQSDERVYVLERRQTAGIVREGISSSDQTTYLLRYYDIRDLPTPSKSAPSTNAAARKPNRELADQSSQKGVPTK